MRAAVLIALLLAVVAARAQPVAPSAPSYLAREVPPWARVAITKTVRGFDRPIAIASAKDGSDRLFVAEQSGLVRVVDRTGSIAPQPFVDVRALLGAVGGEQGLLGLAFHPRFGSTDARLFFAYTDLDGNNAYAQATAAADRRSVPASSVRKLFAVQDFAPNHNGGHLAFGPDGLLYLGTGDGGGGGDPQHNAQNDSSLLGKMLTIDVDSAAFKSALGTVTPTVWAKGLRNPWRYAFDAVTGDLWIADVGQDLWEELHRVDGARVKPSVHPNFGWSVVEGTHCFKRPAKSYRPWHGKIPAADTSACDSAGFEPVVFEYPHGEQDCSITGGVVYRGQRLVALQGTFVFGDYCSGRVWGARHGVVGDEVAPLLALKFPIAAFGTDDAGEMWIADHSGAIHRLGARDPAADPPAPF